MLNLFQHLSSISQFEILSQAQNDVKLMVLVNTEVVELVCEYPEGKSLEVGRSCFYNIFLCK